MPPRWRKVHDCERPERWRVSTPEECEIYELELEAGRVPSAKLDPVLARRRRYQELGRFFRRRKYTEIAPQITTMEELLDVFRKAGDRLVVVKVYSSQCSVKIAARFRRLALKYRREIACCTVEDRAGRDLLAQLEGATAPSVQVFDGERATRLVNCPCEATEFPQVELKVLSAILAMGKRRRSPCAQRQNTRALLNPFSS